MFVDRVRLAYELVEAALSENAVAFVVDVDAVCRAWGLAIEEHTEGNRPAPSGRQDEVGVAVESEGDGSAALIKDDVSEPTVHFPAMPSLRAECARRCQCRLHR